MNDDDKAMGRMTGEQLEPTEPDNLLMRLVFMILIALMMSVAYSVLGVITLIQFVIMLINKRQPNEQLAEFPTFTYSATVSMRLFPRQEVVFQGDKGMLKLTCPFNANVHDLAQLTLETADGVMVERFPRENHYIHQVENFCATVRTGAAYPCPLEFSRGTQAMMDMVFAAGGRG